MSEHFTHIATFEDLARIMLNSPDICDVFKTCIKNEYDCGLLGSTSRGNHLFAIPILEKYKDTYAELTEKKKAQEQITYAIGWLCHRASDLQVKPIFRVADANPDTRYDGYHNSIYHDVNSYKKVYESGNVPSLSEKEIISPATFDYNMQAHKGAKSVDVKKAEPYLSWMWQKDLLSMYEFIEEQDDLDAWLDKFVKQFPKFSENFSDYEKAFNEPDPYLTKRYWQSDNLYNDDDPILQFVRAIQKGEKPPMNLERSLAANNTSHYAKIMIRGHHSLTTASAFFVGNATKHEAYEACEMNEQFRF